LNDAAEPAERRHERHHRRDHPTDRQVRGQAPRLPDVAMMGRGTASIVASPVLVGAVTVLIVIVGVFLAYNANNGLPFVPTYELKAQLPNGQKLVAGNEIRLGGFLVGSIKEIKPAIVKENGKTKAVAVVDMRLQKSIEPLPKDTIVGVRPKSALGLK